MALLHTVILPAFQEQYDQLQRQLQHTMSREAGLQAEVDAYKLEHTQLLTANAQLMEQCTGLNKEVQVRPDPRRWSGGTSNTVDAVVLILTRLQLAWV